MQKETLELTKEYIAKHLFVNGKPADPNTVSRVFSANKRNRKVDNIAPIQYSGFSLMR